MVNKMKQIQVEKITLNIGSGPDPREVERGMKLLEKISGMKPVEAKVRAGLRIAAWKIRPGLAIGSKVTIRKNTEELLLRLLKAVDMKIPESKFTENGFSFGIHEYIEIPEVKYDPKLGIFGLNISVTLKRPGFRVKNRKLVNRKIGKTHRLNKEDAIEFVKNKFGVITEWNYQELKKYLYQKQEEKSSLEITLQKRELLEKLLKPVQDAVEEKVQMLEDTI
mgnify:FL=1